MLDIFGRLVVVVATSILTGCFASSSQYLARPEALPSTGTFSHKPSGFDFPISVGEFQRVDIYKYDVEGEDISVSYNLISRYKHIAATIYIYPSPSIVSLGSPASVIKTARANLCRQDFDAQVQQITARPNVRQISGSEAAAKANNTGTHNLSAHFEYEEIFAGVQQPLLSEFELSCYINGKWNIKFRITHPKSLTVWEEIKQLKMVIQSSK